MSAKMVQQIVLDECNQTHRGRQPLYRKIQNILQKPVILFFTSFVYPVMIEDQDADMLEGLLREVKNLENGFALLISSPGGDGLASERIINICRSYSDINSYETIVPGKAKSAATLICLGSSKIIMSSTSELGPVDPQITLFVDNVKRRFSAYNLVESYKRLFNNAISAEGQNLQPYLQQLDRYDAREIEEFEIAIKLSEDISIKALKNGMLCDLSDEKIKNKIERFITPVETKVHGRALFHSDAIDCGLNVELQDVKENKLWDNIYELYWRVNNYVSSKNRVKCIESEKYSFTLSARPEDMKGAGNE